MSAKKRPISIPVASETASAVKMIIVPNNNQTLRVGSTIRVISTPTPGQNSLPCQAMIVSKPVTIINPKPSTITNQTTASPKKTNPKSPVKNTIKGPSGAGTITILSRQPNAAETAGAVKMVSNVEKTRILPHHLPVNLTTTIELCPETSNLPLLPRPPPPRKDPNRIPLSEECPPPEELANPPPAAPPKQYVYKSGTQFPPNLNRPRKGCTLDVLLETHPMIEILSLERKESLYYYNAICHSCKIEFKSSSAKTLSQHCVSLTHDRRLSLPEGLTESDIKEQARRKLLISNKKFTSFIETRVDELGESIWCKWCNVKLLYSNDKITAHRYTIKHLSNAAEESDEPQFTEEEKVEKLNKLVEMYPEFLALVNEFDKRINDEYFEYYKTPDQITLQINDLYCKPCRRKFVRTNFHSYREAVIEHIKTKQHKDRMEKMIARQNDPTIPKSPPRKITAYRHDDQDLKEVARSLLAVSETKRGKAPLVDIFTPVSDRLISPASLSRGFQLLDVAIDDKTQNNIFSNLGKANRLRIKKMGKFKSKAGYKKKKRDKERKAFEEKCSHHHQQDDQLEQNVQTAAHNYEHDHNVQHAVPTFSQDQYAHTTVHSYNQNVPTSAPNYQYSYHQQSTSY